MVRNAGIVVFVVGTPALAAVGYNIGATRRELRSWENRLVPPSLETRMAGSAETGTSVCFDARIVAVRF